jgi:hypothetical protein
MISNVERMFFIIEKIIFTAILFHLVKVELYDIPLVVVPSGKFPLIFLSQSYFFIIHLATNTMFVVEPIQCTLLS